MWKSITSVIGNLIKILGDVCDLLMKNQLFQILLGIVVLGILFKIIYSLLIKKRKKNNIEENIDFYFDEKGNIVDDDGTFICSASEAKNYSFYKLAKKRT